MTGYLDLLRLPNVVGAGRGWVTESGRLREGWPATVVLVREKLPKEILAKSALVPREFGGLRTDVIETGTIRALQLARIGRWRPAPGGVSVGHYLITAGTLGVLVRDLLTGEPAILSNNHVLANSNAAELGDPILQPGPVDGGRSDEPNDVLALLARFVPIAFEGDQPPGCLPGLASVLAEFWKREIRGQAAVVNRVDAAIAVVPLRDQAIRTILDVGTVGGFVGEEIGLAVRKSGRTTGFTTGSVQLVGATVRVAYGAGRLAVFEDQIVTSGMSAGGDSGSLVVALDPPAAVGLLFAGSDQVTILNPIAEVLRLLQVSL